MNNKPSIKIKSKGIGFGGLLTIVFIALKLIGYIDWDWIWVLAPLGISLILVILLTVIPLLFVLIATKWVDRSIEKSQTEREPIETNARIVSSRNKDGRV